MSLEAVTSFKSQFLKSISTNHIPLDMMLLFISVPVLIVMYRFDILALEVSW
jgi:hypothetical protein